MRFEQAIKNWKRNENIRQANPIGKNRKDKSKNKW